MIPLFWPAIYKDEWLTALGEVFDTRWIGQGPLVDEFEKQFGDKFGFDYCLSVNSGTSALELAYHIIGIKEGDEVLTPVFTCLYGEETLMLPSGEYKTIRELVDIKYNGKVYSLDEKTRKLEKRRVTGWVKNPLGEHQWYKVSYQHAQNSVSHEGKRGIWATDDHKFLTRRGWIRADNLQSTDFIATSYTGFNETQKQIFTGTMLGDGSIRSGRTEDTSCRFNFLHSKSQASLALLKKEAFSTFPHQAVEKEAYKQSSASTGAVFQASPLWTKERQRWYRNGKKIIPVSLSASDLTDLAIAMWYMDDGSKTPSAAIICSESFSERDNELLVSLLAQVGIDAKMQITKRSDKSIYRIYIGNGNNGGTRGKNVEQFFIRIAKYTPNAMRHKLPQDIANHPDYAFNKNLIINKQREIFYDKVKVWTKKKPLNKTSKLKYVYCLEVEKNHNFIIKNTVVHNCTATNIPLVRRGAKLNFLDINDKLVVDYEDIKRKISKNTKALVVVTLGGIRVDDRIFDLAKKYGIPVVIDAAQSLGIPEPKGDYVCYSFQAIKHFTTGDGGMFVVRNKKEYERVRKLRWFGIDREKKRRVNWKWRVNHKMAMDIEEPGFKFHLNDVAAALGLVGLKHSNESLRYRKKLCELYNSSLPNHTLVYGGAYWLIAILTDKRDELMDKLEKKGIESDLVQIRNDIFRVFGKTKQNLPNMKRLEDKYLYLPLHLNITPKDVKYISNIINESRQKPRSHTARESSKINNENK